MRNDVEDTRGEATIRAGDVVRFEFGADGLWFYCCIERVLDRSQLLCRVVEAQSWPELGASGILPGRTYVAPSDCVLSIVSRADSIGEVAADLISR